MLHGKGGLKHSKSAPASILLNVPSALLVRAIARDGHGFAGVFTVLRAVLFPVGTDTTAIGVRALLGLVTGHNLFSPYC